MEQNKISKMCLVSFIFFTLVSVITVSLFYMDNQKLSEDNFQLAKRNVKIVSENIFFEDYYKVRMNMETAKNVELFAGVFYDMSNVYYEGDWFEDAIVACESAREDYSEANGYYHKAKVLLEQLEPIEEYKEIIPDMIKMMDCKIELNNCLYESCEYFESACRSYNNDNYNQAEVALEKTNEKVRKHDDLVNDCNDYIAKVALFLEDNE